MKKFILILSMMIIFIIGCKKKEYITNTIPASPASLSGSYYGRFEITSWINYGTSSMPSDTTIYITAAASNQPTDGNVFPDQFQMLSYNDSIVGLDSLFHTKYERYFYTSSANSLNPLNHAHSFFTNSKWNYSSNSLGSNVFYFNSAEATCSATIPSTISLSASTTFTVANVQHCDDVKLRIGAWISKDLTQNQNSVTIYPVELYDYSPGMHETFTVFSTNLTDTVVNNKRYLFRKYTQRDYTITFVQ